jgi:hypothetical protein
VYASQVGDDPTRPSPPCPAGAFLDVLAARATFYGAMIGAERGEPFTCRGPLAVDGLPELEPPAPTARGYRSTI